MVYPFLFNALTADGLRQWANLFIGAMQNAQVAWLAWCLAACAEQYDTVGLSGQYACQPTQLGFRLSCESMLYNTRT